MKARILASIVYCLYRTLLFSWRVKLIEPPEMQKQMREGSPFLMAHWHGDELVLLHLIGRYKTGTIVSTSKDGEIMNHLIKWFGARTSRGSSTRGAVGALKGLIALIKEGCSSSFAVDGPKGPIYKVKPGVFEVARLLQLQTYWSGVSCDRAFEFPKSWNKTYLPKPFARVHVQWYGPLAPPSKDDDPRAPERALDLETKLHAAKQQAVASIAEDRGGC